MLDFIRFFIRNKEFFFNRNSISSLGVRNTKEYRQAMKEYLIEHPSCEFCGRSKKVDVHHKIPVSMVPEFAADKTNMVTLCRKPQCHFIVGHMGNWKSRNEKIEQILAIMPRQVYPS